MSHNMLESNDSLPMEERIKRIDEVFGWSVKELEFDVHIKSINLKELAMKHCLTPLNPGDKLDEEYYDMFGDKFHNYIIWQLFKLMGDPNPDSEYMREYERRNRFYERQNQTYLIPIKDSLESKYSMFENIISDIVGILSENGKHISLDKILFRILVNRCSMDMYPFERVFIPKDKYNSYPLFKSFLKTILLIYGERHEIMNILNE